jgi:hypothetical protein
MFLAIFRWIMNRLRPIRTAYTSGKNDLNDWGRCPRCGFINKISRLSTPDRTDGVHIEDTQVASDPGNPNDYNGTLVALDNPEMLGMVAKIGDDGINAVTDYYAPRAYIPQVGCAFCGQTNLVK